LRKDRSFFSLTEEQIPRSMIKIDYNEFLNCLLGIGKLP
jgi:hypothetical protein